MSLVICHMFFLDFIGGRLNPRPRFSVLVIDWSKLVIFLVKWRCFDGCHCPFFGCLWLLGFSFSLLRSGSSGDGSSLSSICFHWYYFVVLPVIEVFFC